jgi:hypothetical protein
MIRLEGLEPVRSALQIDDKDLADTVRKGLKLLEPASVNIQGRSGTLGVSERPIAVIRAQGLSGATVSGGQDA